MSNLFGGATLISDTDTLALWMVLGIIVAVSVFLEQKYKWAAKLSAPVLTIVIGFAATNLYIIPSSAAVYKATSSYLIPLSLALMLFTANIKDIIKNSGKMFFCMNLGAVATVAGAFVAFFLFKDMPEVADLAGAYTGAYIGGGANAVAVAVSTGMSETVIAARAFAGNLLLMIAIIFLAWVPGTRFFRKHYAHPYEEALEAAGTNEEGKTNAAVFWKRKEMSLLDIAKTLATGLVMVVVSSKLANLFGAWLTFENANAIQSLPKMIFGNLYVILTIVAVIAVAIFPNYFKKLKGADELGTYMMYLYFVTVGCCVNMHTMASSVPKVILFGAVIMLVHFVIIFGGGKLFKQNVEEIAVASNANLGGPFTAAAMAVSKGYSDLRVPGLMCGIWGNTIGTIAGLVVYAVLNMLV